jgi:hypothetical protein
MSRSGLSNEDPIDQKFNRVHKGRQIAKYVLLATAIMFIIKLQLLIPIKRFTTRYFGGVLKSMLRFKNTFDDIYCI